MSPEHCGAEQECLANRCMMLGADPVAGKALRRLLEPSAIAVVRRERPGSGLPPSVTLGGPEALAEELLVSFPPLPPGFVVDSAFLLLAPSPGAMPSAHDVPVSVSLIDGDWAPGMLSESPGGRAPHTAGLARTRPPLVLRLDVTRHLRALAEPGDGHGLLVQGGAAARGATYSTGIGRQAPRLEVYGWESAR